MVEQLLHRSVLVGLDAADGSITLRVEVRKCCHLGGSPLRQMLEKDIASVPEHDPILVGIQVSGIGAAGLVEQNLVLAGVVAGRYEKIEGGTLFLVVDPLPTIR